MRGRVVDRKAVPDPISRRLAVVVGQGLAVVDVEVIDDQMNRGGVWIVLDQMTGDWRELGGRAIRRSEGKVLSHLSFHSAEDICGAATLVFTILTRLPAWRRWGRRSDIGMQHDRFFIQANYRFVGIVRLFIDLQNVLHSGDVFFVELGHRPHFFPATV